LLTQNRHFKLSKITYFTYMDAQITNPASSDLLKEHFIHHLNRVYHGKKYLQKHLPDLNKLSSFKKLKQGLQETWEDINKQIGRIEEIYRLIDGQPDKESCVPIITVFKDAFEPQEYGLQNTLLNDIDIILYLQLLEHINITSYRMLKILAASMKEPAVEQLLLESFDESTDNDKLFVMIADEYVQLRHNN
jgi:ferritin-like metal-binding protein YciE